MAVPRRLTGEGELFMLRVRGDSMIDLGILEVKDGGQVTGYIEKPIETETFLAQIQSFLNPPTAP